jgi:hypothetical protein
LAASASGGAGGEGEDYPEALLQCLKTVEEKFFCAPAPLIHVDVEVACKEGVHAEGGCVSLQRGEGSFPVVGGEVHTPDGYIGGGLGEPKDAFDGATGDQNAGADDLDGVWN